VHMGIDHRQTDEVSNIQPYLSHYVHIMQQKLKKKLK